MTDPDLARRPGELLSALVQFDTTNPPGDERACIEYIDDLLSAAGLPTETYARDPDRPNLLARLEGGEAPPLLLYGHVDVVPTEGQDWTHPPFAGRIEDGFVWGRGTLDMKGGVTMMLAALLRAAREGLEPAGDVLFLALSDEEAGGDEGAAYMVEEHPELFADVEYAIGEFGGFPLRVDDTTFYPVQVAEKQVCWLEATFEGPGGHASRPQRDGPMARLGSVLTALAENRLPTHVTPAAEEFVEALAAESSAERAAALRAVLDPERTEEALEELGEFGDRLDAMLHNTVSPTVVEGGSKTNVHPSEVTLTLDGRLLPGFDDEDMLREIERVAGDHDDVAWSVTEYSPSGGDVDLRLFDLLEGTILAKKPDAVPVPYLMTAATDARFFDRVGVQTYGFTPMDLPADFDFMDLAHAADERIPVEAVEFGADAIHRVIAAYEG